MKVFVISGSRNPGGYTAKCGDSLLEGVREGGGDGEQIFLPLMNIERCRQCNDSGWGICRNEGRCIMEDDDFASIVEKIRSAEAVVFATPVYFSDLSESTRAFLDRLRRICRFMDKQPDIFDKPTVGICVAGGSGGGGPECAAEMVKILSKCRLDMVDMVVARRQNIDMKQAILKATGKWLADSAQS